METKNSSDLAVSRNAHEHLSGSEFVLFKTLYFPVIVYVVRDALKIFI